MSLSVEPGFGDRPFRYGNPPAWFSSGSSPHAENEQELQPGTRNECVCYIISLVVAEVPAAIPVFRTKKSVKTFLRLTQAKSNLLFTVLTVLASWDNGLLLYVCRYIMVHAGVPHMTISYVPLRRFGCLARPAPAIPAYQPSQRSRQPLLLICFLYRFRPGRFLNCSFAPFVSSLACPRK